MSSLFNQRLTTSRDRLGRMVRIQLLRGASGWIVKIRVSETPLLPHRHFPGGVDMPVGSCCTPMSIIRKRVRQNVNNHRITSAHTAPLRLRVSSYPIYWITFLQVSGLLPPIRTWSIFAGLPNVLYIGFCRGKSGCWRCTSAGNNVRVYVSIPPVLSGCCQQHMAEPNCSNKFVVTWVAGWRIIPGRRSHQNSHWSWVCECWFLLAPCEKEKYQSSWW